MPRPEVVSLTGIYNNAPAFEGKVKGAISEQSVEKYQPGKEIFVKYDPNDHGKLTIDHS